MRDRGHAERSFATTHPSDHRKAGELWQSKYSLAQDDAAIASGKGIGAAREWIKSEFERYSKDCGGCLEVKTDDFMQPPSRRVKDPTRLVNVYAVLKGTDPASAKRIYVVSGHYDSRNSDNFNVTDPAPGANDDASGTAVSLECARVMSKHKVSRDGDIPDCAR